MDEIARSIPCGLSHAFQSAGVIVDAHECLVPEVHRRLGPGFLEAVYREALRHELGARGIPWRAEVSLPIRFKGHEPSGTEGVLWRPCGE